MLIRCDLVSDGRPWPPLRILSLQCLIPHFLFFSDPQALNDFLHGSEKVSAGREALGMEGAVVVFPQTPHTPAVCPGPDWAPPSPPWMRPNSTPPPPNA